MYPFGDAFEDILAVDVERDGARPLECGQRLDDRHHFHAVVGRPEFATKQFFFSARTGQQRTPAAGAGVAFAGAVGVDHHMLSGCTRVEVSHGVVLFRAKPGLMK